MSSNQWFIAPWSLLQKWSLFYIAMGFMALFDGSRALSYIWLAAALAANLIDAGIKQGKKP